MSHVGFDWSTDQTHLSNATWTCADASAHVCVSLCAYVLLAGCVELACRPAGSGAHSKIASIRTVCY